MASRRFFGYDPYGYYYAAPSYDYPYPYYQRRQQPSTARGVGGFFPATAAAEPVTVRPRPAATAQAVNPKPKTRTVSIPVHFDTEPQAVPKKRAPSAEAEAAAAARLQAAARGFLARRAVRSLRAVEREAEEVGKKVTREVEALRGDARARVAVGEALMRLLLRLDAVRGARGYRKRVTKRVLALQDAVDALEPRPEPAAAAAEEPESVLTKAGSEEVAVESGMAPQLSDAAEQSGEIEAATEMEVEGDRAGGESCATDETEQAAAGANHGDNMSDNADAEGEWEMVTEEAAPAAETEAPAEQPRQLDGKVRKAEAPDGGDLDAKKVMEMVAALCERSAQQCAVIGALAERVDALERAVRRVEDADRQRRRAKKLKKTVKGSNQSKRSSVD